MRIRTVAVIGAGQCGVEAYERARLLGRLLAESGCRVVCGGLSGVMEAVCRGAQEAGGSAIGILPGLDPAEANSWVDVPIVTGLGHMRNFQVIANGEAVVAVEGGYGTLSEIALALKSGKTVIALGRWSGLDGVLPARDPADAVRLVHEHLPKSGNEQ